MNCRYDVLPQEKNNLRCFSGGYAVKISLLRVNDCFCSIVSLSRKKHCITFHEQSVQKRGCLKSWRQPLFFYKPYAVY
jgi:hypothetical protein